MPINLGNSYPIPEGQNPEEPNPVMTLVESFLTQFYERYDNNISKQMVAEAYHTDATFSLSSCFLSNQYVFTYGIRLSGLILIVFVF